MAATPIFPKNLTTSPILCSSIFFLLSSETASSFSKGRYSEPSVRRPHKLIFKADRAARTSPTWTSFKQLHVLALEELVLGTRSTRGIPPNHRHILSPGSPNFRIRGSKDGDRGNSQGGSHMGDTGIIPDEDATSLDDRRQPDERQAPDEDRRRRPHLPLNGLEGLLNLSRLRGTHDD